MGKHKRKTDEDAEDMEEYIRELEAKLNRKKRKLAKLTNEAEPDQIQSRSLTPQPLVRRQEKPTDTAGTSKLTSSPQDPQLSPRSHTPPPEPECEVGSNAEPETLPEEFLTALGEEGTVSEEKGEPIRKEIADRWTNLVQTGMKKENLNVLLKKYLTPSNFPMATAPILNTEMVAAVSENVLKRDKKFEYRQSLTGKVLSCLGSMLTDIMKGNLNSIKLIEGINDAGKILCNMNHYDSLTRRHFILTSVQGHVKQAVVNVPVGKFLFGDNLADRLKAAKAVEKSGSQLKITAPKKPPVKFTSTTSKNLNWKSPPLRTPQQGYKPRGGQKNQPKRTTYKQHQAKPARRH